MISKTIFSLLILISFVTIAVFTYVNVQVLSLSMKSPSCRDDVLSHDVGSSTKENAGENNAALASSSLERSLLDLYGLIPEPHWEDTENGENHYNYQILTNIVRRRRYVDKEDFTLVSHGSIDKFPLNLLDQVSHWQGPLSFALHLSHPKHVQQFCRQLQHLQQQIKLDQTIATKSPLFLFQEYVSIHVLMERHGGDLAYPINALRNLAQGNIESNYFLLMDVDFLPSRGLYEFLMEQLTLSRNINSGRRKNSDSGVTTFWDALRAKTLFVLPAFEQFNNNTNNNTINMAPPSLDDFDTVPRTKQDLLQHYQQHRVAPFHAYFPPGHYPTNYPKWLSSSSSSPTTMDNNNMMERNKKNLLDQHCFPTRYQKRFEPYIVGYKRGLPPFWEGFRGFGFNAAVWFWELDLQGFDYCVLWDHFVVHRNHAGRQERQVQDGSIAKMQLRRFMRYISRRYNVSQPQLRYWKGRKYLNGTHVTLH